MSDDPKGLVEVGIHAAMEIGAGHNEDGKFVKDVIVEQIVEVPKTELKDEEKKAKGMVPEIGVHRSLEIGEGVLKPGNIENALGSCNKTNL